MAPVNRPGVPSGAVEADDVLAGKVIELSGIPMLLSASDHARAEAVASLFRHARVTTAAPRCTLVFADDELGLPETPPTVTVADARLWHAESATLWIQSDEGLVARCDDRAIAICGDAPTPAREFRFVCLIALTHLLARHGFHLLHGAAMVVAERTLLVLGGTGTGKSTLAFAAHTRGWPVLADDAVIVRHADGVVHVSGLPRPISVGADVVVDAVGGGRPVPDDLRARTELPPGTLVATTNPVATVVVMAGTDDRGSGIDAMRGPDVLRAVLQASTSLADSTVRPELFALAGALARLPAWSVRNRKDPSRALDDATSRLDDLTRLLCASPVDPPGMTGS